VGVEGVSYLMSGGIPSPARQLFFGPPARPLKLVLAPGDWSPPMPVAACLFELNIWRGLGVELDPSYVAPAVTSPPLSGF